jgi:hypothetical protein
MAHLPEYCQGINYFPFRGHILGHPKESLPRAPAPLGMTGAHGTSVWGPGQVPPWDDVTPCELALRDAHEHLSPAKPPGTGERPADLDREIRAETERSLRVPAAFATATDAQGGAQAALRAPTVQAPMGPAPVCCEPWVHQEAGGPIRLTGTAAYRHGPVPPSGDERMCVQPWPRS